MRKEREFSLYLPELDRFLSAQERVFIGLFSLSCQPFLQFSNKPHDSRYIFVVYKEPYISFAS
jgi:hypothetical protein